MDTGAVPELLILAPAHERGMSELWQAASANQLACPADQPFNPWIEAFLDEGVNFAFDDDHRLPTELPDDLTGVRCIVLERALQDELRSGERAEQLLAFEAAGGYVFSPPASALWTGAPAGVG